MTALRWKWLRLPTSRARLRGSGGVRGRRGPRTRGFTLVEVVVALLLLEIGVMAALGTVVLALSTQRRAEQIETAVSLSEAVLDSIRGDPDGGGGTRAWEGVRVSWTVDGEGRVELQATDTLGSRLLRVDSRVSRP